MEKNKIENINLHDLVENQDNPRSIEPQQMQKLVEYSDVSEDVADETNRL